MSVAPEVRGYKELGLPVGASRAEVRRAFLKIARKCHPDKCSTPGSVERFRRAQEAFQTISGMAAKTSVVAQSAPDEGDDSDGWSPPPPPQAKPSAPPEPEPEEPEPVLCLCECVEALRVISDDAISTPKHRRRFLQAGILWPWSAKGKAIRKELLRAVRDELDRRVASQEWPQLSKTDLVWWLEGHGCSLKYVLEDDSVDKEKLQRLVQTRFSGSGVPDATPLPCLETESLVGVNSDGCENAPDNLLGLPAHEKGQVRTLVPAKRAPLEDPRRRTRTKNSPHAADSAVATAEDYAKWLHQALQRGKEKEAADYLLKQAAAGAPFRGKHIELAPLRTALADFKC